MYGEMTMKSKLPVGKFEYEGINISKTYFKKISLNKIEKSLIVKNFLSKEDRLTLLKLYESQSKIPVGINGIVSSYKEGDKICSYRATLFSNNLAKQLFLKIKDIAPTFEGYDVVGINESFRFIDYLDEGILIPHYDEGYTNSRNETSLATIVIYIEQAEKGYTEFVKEYRNNHDYKDWDRMAQDEEIIEVAKTESGDCLIFPHRTLHQGSKTIGRKVIIRTDIMYRIKK